MSDLEQILRLDVKKRDLRPISSNFYNRIFGRKATFAAKNKISLNVKVVATPIIKSNNGRKLITQICSIEITCSKKLIYGCVCLRS